MRPSLGKNRIRRQEFNRFIYVRSKDYWIAIYFVIRDIDNLLSIQNTIGQARKEFRDGVARREIIQGVVVWIRSQCHLLVFDMHNTSILVGTVDNPIKCIIKDAVNIPSFSCFIQFVQGYQTPHVGNGPLDFFAGTHLQRIDIDVRRVSSISIFLTVADVI